ncbi:MAG: phosphopantetheine-binding protein [Proteobacteria bacterium]|nr:phosphopantetheine-binding protein [Pseudomonadota bacterium]
MLTSDFARAGMAPDDVGDNLDLLDAGIVDSFGFINLSLQLEETFNIPIDISELDDDSPSTIANLVSMIAQKQTNRTT